MITLRPIQSKRTLFLLIRRWNSTSVEKPRINPVGIQYLSSKLDKRVFPSKLPKEPTPDEQDLIELSKNYLSTHGLLGKKTNISDPISFDIPKLEGNTLDEHFRKIGLFASAPYLERAKALASLDKLPKQPKVWLKKSGWYRYESGLEPVKVNFPEDSALVFDVETLYKVSKYPVMATAVSEKAWYGWVSPVLTGESKSFEHLIPMNTLKQEKVIVGHNIGYDRARIKEEYDLKDTKGFYLDTMSLHVAVSGMCSQQRARWIKHDRLKKDETSEADDISQSEIEDPWMNFSSLNSLAAVADFYFNKKVDKTIRDSFGGGDINLIKEDFQNLMKYCANDVLVTHKVYSHVLPEFLKVCPHPVSFAALKFMGSGILPTNSSWYDYIKDAESLYQKMRQDVDDRLVELAEKAVKLKDTPSKFENDPWLSQLDWEIKPTRVKKNGELHKNQKLPGYPNWYKDLWNSKEEKIIITTRTRVTPLLLKLKYEGYPVVWDDTNGWCFKADKADHDRLIAKNYKYEQNFGLTEEEIEERVPTSYPDHRFFRVPNKQGPEHRTTLLLAKAFASSFEKGVLKSESPFAQEALDMNASCSYWISSRERIMSQFVVDKTKDYSIILPQVVTMGTITRRAVERTWLTASNAKKSRIGSELKSKIIAPPGYCFVGADVDSEELWIASLVGDAMFKMHGGTSIGWMTLEGTKIEGTDLHSKTAEILGINRNEAKVFNYGRIYGAGVKFATTLLKQFNPELSDLECSARAKNLYAETKGQQTRVSIDKVPTRVWFGGSESVLFNELERIANQDNPRTPTLGAGITKALMKKNLNMNSFLPSRVNWAIQSSGVDYLHLLCVSMNYLLTKFSVKARLSLSVHDEIRYLCEEKDKYKVAMCLQISNIWTRAIFSENLGIQDLPQSCAFFSAVDIDHILRKEVDMDCITPSNPIAATPGESLDIVELLKREDSLLGPGKRVKIPKLPDDGAIEPEPVEPEGIPVEKPNFQYSYDNKEWKRTIAAMQTTQSDKELKSILREYRKNYGRLNFKDVLSGELVLSEKAKKKSGRKVKIEGETISLSSEDDINKYLSDKSLDADIALLNMSSQKILKSFKSPKTKLKTASSTISKSSKTTTKKSTSTSTTDSKSASKKKILSSKSSTKKVTKKATTHKKNGALSDTNTSGSSQTTTTEFPNEPLAPLHIETYDQPKVFDREAYETSTGGYNPADIDRFFSQGNVTDESKSLKSKEYIK